MPFVTESLWDHFGFGGPGTLIRAEWPQAKPIFGIEAAQHEVEWVVNLITQVRAVRAEMNVPPSRLAPILLRSDGPAALERAQRWIEPIRRMARASEVLPLTGDLPPGSAQAVIGDTTIVLPLADVIDLAAERTRLGRDRGRALQEVEKIDKKLSNADFLGRAPAEIVDEIRERRSAAAAELARLEAALARID
jgi:valyl-tRNA synthetase